MVGWLGSCLFVWSSGLAGCLVVLLLRGPAVVVQQIIRIFVCKTIGYVLAGAVLQHNRNLMLNPQPLGEVLSRFGTHSVTAVKFKALIVIV